MYEDILDKVATVLLSILSLLFRGIGSKLIKMTLATTDGHITPLNYEVISWLEETGTLHIAQIGDELHIARAQLTHLIDEPVDLIMVKRETGKANMGTINITFTENGKAFIDERKIRLPGIVMEAMSSLKDEGCEDIANTLNKLRGMLSKFQYDIIQAVQGAD